MWLKQSTAKVISFGPFVSQSDGVTLVTSLVSALDHASTGIKLSKSGGALTVRSATVTASTYDSFGNYLVTLSTTDTNTLGNLRVQFTDATTNLPVWRDFSVIPANVYDSIIAGTDRLDIDLAYIGDNPVASIAGTTPIVFPITIPSLAQIAAQVTSDHGVGSYVADAGIVDANIVTIDGMPVYAPPGTAGVTFPEDVASTVGSGLDAAGMRAALGMATANLDTQLSDIDNFIDTEITTLITKTNGLVMGQSVIGSTGNDTTHVHIPSLTYADDQINEQLLVILDVSTSEYHARWIADWTNSSKLALVATLPFTPQNAVDNYWLLSMRRDSSLTAAEIRTAVGLATANLDTQLSTIDDFVDTEVAAIVTSLGTVNTKLDTIDDFIDTEITAITSKLNGLVISQGTIGATGNDTTHLHLAGLAYIDDAINNYLLTILDVSTGLYYSCWISDWANTGDLATVPTLPFTPQASTDTYWLLPIRQDVTGGSGLDAAGVRSAIGLASANLDTQLTTIDDYVDTEVAAIKAKTDLIPASPAAVGSAMTLAAGAISDSTITLPTEVTGFATTFFTKFLQLFNRYYGKVTYNKVSNTIVVTKADGSTTATTQATTTNATNDIVDKAT